VHQYFNTFFRHLRQAAFFLLFVLTQKVTKKSRAEKCCPAHMQGLPRFSARATARYEHYLAVDLQSAAPLNNWEPPLFIPSLLLNSYSSY
jgi:hypothetical protein